MGVTTGKDKGNSLDPFEDEEVGPLPIAPDGGIAPIPVKNASIKPADEDDVICLRGPCRHYFEMVTKAELEDKHLDAPIKQSNRFCTVISGSPTDITDRCVYDCNRWSPRLNWDADEKDRQERIENYYRQKGIARTRSTDPEDYAMAISGPLTKGEK